MDTLSTLNARVENGIGFIQIYRPNDNNTINTSLIEEFHRVLDAYEGQVSVIVLEGLPEVFCFGADFKEIHSHSQSGALEEFSARSLYRLWTRLAVGPFVSVCHVRGKTNAGGIGFVSSCDIVIADANATFSLSELLFGIYPACVLPFLIRRVGLQRANYLTLMTKPISIEDAFTYQLVDAWSDNSRGLLAKHLVRLKCLSIASVGRYKQYISKLNGIILESEEVAVAENKSMHKIPGVLEGISGFVDKGVFPWEKS